MEISKMRLKLVILLEILRVSQVICGSGPSNCQKAIINCCDPASSQNRDFAQHFRCFEVNLCPGLYWTGKSVCSPSSYSKVLESISRLKVDTEENTVRQEKVHKIKVKKPQIKSAVVTTVLMKKKPIKKTFTNSNLRCLRAIILCCNPGRTRLPKRCFEVNNCPGIYWDGRQVCSANRIRSARMRLQRYESLQV